MLVFTKPYAAIIYFIITMYSVSGGDILEAQRTSFLGYTSEVPISGATLQLVRQLESAVWQRSAGDRTVRRYFDKYEMPFFEPKVTTDD